MRPAWLLLAPLLLVCTQQLQAQSSPAPDAKGKEPEFGAQHRPLDGEALRRAAFDPARLRARRQALLEGMPKNAVVVIAAPRHTSGDLFSYRASPDFLYLSGQTAPRLMMLLAPGADVLFAPPRDRRHELWNGPRLAVGTELAKVSGFGEVVPYSKRKERIKAALERTGGSLYVLGVAPKDLGLPATTKLRTPADRIHFLRQVKDARELALLQRACDITAASLSEAIQSVQPGQFEYEVEAVIEYLFRRYGAQRPGFASIVGAGPNSCVLHYSANSRRFKAGELIVMDVGAEYHGYTADITRTVPTSGKFSKRQREVYEIVLRAQDAGIAACKPGAKVRDVHAAARKVIADAGYGKYFLHGTSHWLGLDVHDVGSYRRVLAPGMVLTVEPGIYIAKESLGIRIEDDILVTAKGPVVLSAGVPRDPDALEALLAKRGVGKRLVSPLPKRKAPTKRPRFFRLR
ncbi:MAG: aminopeptidase P N-terminal domain-containing protein [Planctomycetes bacterium]|nr:aminopeptidase P N-terminal domain-containing protein [Planctomycetota bacterium]